MSGSNIGFRLILLNISLHGPEYCWQQLCCGTGGGADEQVTPVDHELPEQTHEFCWQLEDPELNPLH